MATKKQTPVSVGFAVNKKSADQLKTAGVNALEEGHVVVKSAGRTLTTGGGGGYETRLWEKITCDILGGRLNPGDLVTQPDLLGLTVTPVAGLKKAARARKSKKK